MYAVDNISTRESNGQVFLNCNNCLPIQTGPIDPPLCKISSCFLRCGRLYNNSTLGHFLRYFPLGFSLGCSLKSISLFSSSVSLSSASFPSVGFIVLFFTFQFSSCKRYSTSLSSSISSRNPLVSLLHIFLGAFSFIKLGVLTVLRFIAAQFQQANSFDASDMLHHEFIRSHWSVEYAHVQKFKSLK
nr:hypothetical protein 3 - fruit fly (Drosophila melanogaster) transposon FB [Drosophila melanogaster]